MVDEAGKRTAGLVPLNDWERMQEALEELADIRAYDEAERNPIEQVPFECVLVTIEYQTAKLFPTSPV